MSAQFKLAKKKYTQNDLRRLMQEQKSKTKPAATEQKIESPLAKYNDLGQLTCLLCKSVVRSEAVWKVHVNSKSHKENVAIAKQLKEKLQSSSQAQQTVKRSNDSTSSAAQKDTPPEKKIKIEEPTKKNAPSNGIPADFFDSRNSAKKTEAIASQPTAMDMDASKDDPLPEGFFDDPVKDAKIRNLEYKNPQDEEWEKFQKEMKEETTLAREIIAGEQEEATTERQIEEIDEQIHNWSRVLHMEQKQEIASQKARQRPVKMEQESDSGTDEDDEQFNEFLDWRAKKFQK